FPAVRDSDVAGSLPKGRLKLVFPLPGRIGGAGHGATPLHRFILQRTALPGEAESNRAGPVSKNAHDLARKWGARWNLSEPPDRYRRFNRAPAGNASMVRAYSPAMRS